MTEITTMSMFINMQERQKLSRRIQNVVESLLAALNIDPCGRQLIMACGTGEERTNREALIAWMRKSICCEQRLDSFSTEQIAHELRHHLERCIGSWCD
ncbi:MULTISPECIES: hypothetical protein [Rheinheimera]|jgi:hypothetical protein|uniref:hypothetical protein n=1 Tax=Rheinheimera TaxID=67575 RepID=UPI000744CC12|nr:MULTISPECIES: hypothetical protein [unclassified Rheinheimera]ALZ74750.1 hypothetical protein ATY27_02575 [Rheinheimera sp. F8]